MSRFSNLLTKHGLSLRREKLQTLQINVGRKCNQACRHCHVDAAPWRTEMMSDETMERVIHWIADHRPAVVDITGGAPELHPQFRRLVASSRDQGCRVLDRNNLTIIEESGWDWLPEFLAAHQVEVVASLPCYLEKNVNQQRGSGVFSKSISALKKLNQVGYGSHLPLTLVYNPLGPTLPPDQKELESDYKQALWDSYGVRFSQLFTITNQPIARFAEDLRRAGLLEDYMELLVANFNPTTVPEVMCRSTLSVDYLGRLYDCDFNQMLELPLISSQDKYLWDISPDILESTAIHTRDHCLACTAGSGSSCGGALEMNPIAVEKG